MTTLVQSESSSLMTIKQVIRASLLQIMFEVSDHLQPSKAKASSTKLVAIREISNAFRIQE
jgi:hypothetical protein